MNKGLKRVASLLYERKPGSNGGQETGLEAWCQAAGQQNKKQWAETDAEEVPHEHEDTFPVWSTEHLNRLHREAWESPSLKILKNCLDAILCNGK